MTNFAEADVSPQNTDFKKWALPGGGMFQQKNVCALGQHVHTLHIRPVVSLLQLISYGWGHHWVSSRQQLPDPGPWADLPKQFLLLGVDKSAQVLSTGQTDSSRTAKSPHAASLYHSLCAHRASTRKPSLHGNFPNRLSLTAQCWSCSNGCCSHLGALSNFLSLWCLLLIYNQCCSQRRFMKLLCS